MREQPETRSTPVIILTAMPAVEGESTGMDFGVVHYITKPFVHGTVESAIRNALRDSASA
jgi:DNA-binding response OmpR family regulator